MTKSFEERWGVYCNGEIVDPIPFIKEEISQAKKEERERIVEIISEIHGDFGRGNPIDMEINNILQAINISDEYST
jgi:hypothetical protein